VQITGVPVAPASGSTHCLTVTGANGAVKAEARGAAQIVSVVASTTRPGQWTICFTIGAGAGTIAVQDAKDARFTTMRGR
jgi:hypothetical protein